MARSLGRLILSFIACSFVAVSATSVLQAQDECASSGDRQQVECLAEKIDAAKREMQTVYRAALAKMPESDTGDRRRNRLQLVQAQTAWQAYIGANCAYVGGAEGGSNLWVTNLDSRCELAAIRERASFLRHEAGLPGSTLVPAGLSASEPNSDAQRMLDTLATAKLSTETVLNLPASFAAWSADQQRIIPRQQLARCVAFWGMANPNGTLKLLPTQDASEGNKLALEVCEVGHMPRDWPSHSATIADIERKLQLSADSRDRLLMPPSLTR